MAGIYIHIPFCKQACHYCNFHFSTSLKTKDKLVSALLKELDLYRNYLGGQTLNSIYFGGGTPSLLSGPELNSIFQQIEKFFPMSDSMEITLESNPDDLTEEKLKILADSPVNRLSIGVQSFFDDELIFFNRGHNSEAAIKSIERATQHGFNAITADLIYGIPGSTTEKVVQNIRTLIELGVQHISTYALTVEPKTALAHFIRKGKVEETPQEEVSEQYSATMEYLNENDFVHYEISNFARSGHFAIHNTNYWKGVHYLGIGPSAHSFDGSSRRWNIAHNIKYIKAIENEEDPFETEVLSISDKYNEYIMTSLRTMWGCDEKVISDFGESYLESFKAQVQKIRKEWIQVDIGLWKLTDEGKHFADRIASTLFI